MWRGVGSEIYDTTVARRQGVVSGHRCECGGRRANRVVGMLLRRSPAPLADRLTSLKALECCSLANRHNQSPIAL